MPGLTGPPKSGFFYPKLVYGTPAVTIEFPDPAALVLPGEMPLVGQNRATSGKTETLFNRIEQGVQLAWRFLDPATGELVRTYWRDHGIKGRQAVLTLDRFNTCQGQWEYDQYNALFTKAELVNTPFRPMRAAFGRALYTLELVFRQGK